VSESIRWELHCYRSSDEKDVEILSGHSHPATQAQVDAALVVLTGKPLDLLPELDAGVAVVLRSALAATGMGELGLRGKIQTRIEELRERQQRAPDPSRRTAIAIQLDELLGLLADED